MAKTANAEGLERDENGPDYAGAVGEIKHIMAVEQNAKSVSGRQKSNWDRIDAMRVDRRAARAMKQILGLEPDNRTMMLRGLFGLLIAAKDEIDLPGDMVDMMHKAIPEGLHVETPGAVRPKALGRPKADTPAETSPENKGDEAGEKKGDGEGFEEDGNVVALRNRRAQGKDEGGEIPDDLGKPQPDEDPTGANAAGSGEAAK